MSVVSQEEEIHIGAIEVEGRSWSVAVRVANDDIEFVGHLWFADDAWDDEGMRDHGAIPGRTVEDVARHARAIPADELVRRLQRAQADQRRHHGLRKLTENLLDNIRHLNKVATSMRAGLLDVDEAAMEIDSTERKLHEMIDQLRHVAGVI